MQNHGTVLGVAVNIAEKIVQHLLQPGLIDPNSLQSIAAEPHLEGVAIELGKVTRSTCDLLQEGLQLCISQYRLNVCGIATDILQNTVDHAEQVVTTSRGEDQ